MEKASGVVWINVFRDNYDGSIWKQYYSSRLNADKACVTHAETDSRIACVEVPWTEGMGLEPAL